MSEKADIVANFQETFAGRHTLRRCRTLALMALARKCRFEIGAGDRNAVLALVLLKVEVDDAPNPDAAEELGKCRQNKDSRIAQQAAGVGGSQDQ